MCRRTNVVADGPVRGCNFVMFDVSVWGFYSMVFLRFICGIWAEWACETQRAQSNNKRPASLIGKNRSICICVCIRFNSWPESWCPFARRYIRPDFDIHFLSIVSHWINLYEWQIFIPLPRRECCEGCKMFYRFLGMLFVCVVGCLMATNVRRHTQQTANNVLSSTASTIVTVAHTHE